VRSQIIGRSPVSAKWADGNQNFARDACTKHQAPPLLYTSWDSERGGGGWRSGRLRYVPRPSRRRYPVEQRLEGTPATGWLSTSTRGGPLTELQGHYYTSLPVNDSNPRLDMQYRVTGLKTSPSSAMITDIGSIYCVYSLNMATIMILLSRQSLIRAHKRLFGISRNVCEVSVY
jgi:hypothetical protein